MLKISYAQRSRAGAYEQRRFEEGRRAWRRRVLPRVRWALLPGAAICVAYEVAVPSTLHFLAGFWAGGMACLYLVARDMVPAHIEHHAQGAEGERRTAKTLASLVGDGWDVAHDIDTGRGNRDHVVVGPGGVFLLDSKRLGGTVTVEDGTVRVERVDDPRDSYELRKLAAIMRREACRVHEEIKRATGVRVWVTPVVVFWSRYDAGVSEQCGVVWLHGDLLNRWLREQPHRLSQLSVTRLATYVAKTESPDVAVREASRRATEQRLSGRPPAREPS